MTTTSAEKDVLTLIERGTDLPTIEDQTGWDPDDISGLADSNGFVFDIGTFQFRDRLAVPEPPKPAPIAPGTRPAQRDLIEVGKASTVAKVRKAADRAEVAMQRLAEAVEETRATDAARREIEALEEQLRVARARLRGEHVEAPATADAAAIRAWAGENGIECPSRDRLPQRVVDAYREAVAS